MARAVMQASGAPRCRASFHALSGYAERDMNDKQFVSWLMLTALVCAGFGFAQIDYPDLQQVVYPILAALLFFLALWCRATNRRLHALEQELSSRDNERDA